MKKEELIESLLTARNEIKALQYELSDVYTKY